MTPPVQFFVCTEKGGTDNYWKRFGQTKVFPLSYWSEFMITALQPFKTGFVLFSKGVYGVLFSDNYIVFFWKVYAK